MIGDRLLFHSVGRVVAKGIVLRNASRDLSSFSLSLYLPSPPVVGKRENTGHGARSINHRSIARDEAKRELEMEKMGCRVRVTRLLISNLAMVSVTISCGTRFNDLAFSWWAIVGRVNGRSCRDFSGPRVWECCEWMTSCGNIGGDSNDWREFAILWSSLFD